MILVGNQRGGASDLAHHLTKEENERVVIHELRGFASDNLASAFQESFALSRGTACKQHLYSLSLNPPKNETVGPEIFEDAVMRAEERLGLTGQPRAIVFHEKYGADGELRRHAHAVWCRIVPENMTAVHMSFDRQKLNDVGRELFLEHGWKMPRGFVRSEERDPRNFSLAEWQQAKRAKKDPKQLKTMFQDCWAISDSQGSFTHALNERGYILARGDRRGVVAVDYKGEVYAIARYVGIKTKDVRARVSEPENLPDVTGAHEQAASIVTDRLEQLKEEQRLAARARFNKLAEERREQEKTTRLEAEHLRDQQAARARTEKQQRDARIRKGLRGLLDFITGKRKSMLAENSHKAEMAKRRDRKEREDLTARQRDERLKATDKAKTAKSEARQTLSELRGDIKALSKIEAREEDRSARREVFKSERRGQKARPRPRRSRDGPPNPQHDNQIKQKQFRQARGTGEDTPKSTRRSRRTRKPEPQR